MDRGGAVVVSSALGGMFTNRASSAYADASPGRRLECDNRLINGTCGVQMQGTRAVPCGTNIEAVISVTRKFDGAGNFTQVDNVKGAMSGFAPDRPVAGTYEVIADCLGMTRRDRPDLVREAVFFRAREFDRSGRAPPRKPAEAAVILKR